MEKPCLHDPAVFPDDGVLQRCLGRAKSSWDELLRFLHAHHPDLTGEWRYYNDGKSWLYKLTQKKNTICWISVDTQKFRTSFYFPDRAEEMIAGSALAQEYRDQYLDAKKQGKKFKAITVEIQQTADLQATRTLIELKKMFK